VATTQVACRRGQFAIGMLTTVQLLAAIVVAQAARGLVRPS
jgi:hypothetical protein